MACAIGQERQVDEWDKEQGYPARERSNTVVQNAPTSRPRASAVLGAASSSVPAAASSTASALTASPSWANVASTVPTASVATASSQPSSSASQSAVLNQDEFPPLGAAGAQPTGGVGSRSKKMPWEAGYDSDDDDGADDQLAGGTNAAGAAEDDDEFDFGDGDELLL